MAWTPAFPVLPDIRGMDRGEGMDVMDWDWIIEGERATEGGADGVCARLHARRARRVFRALVAVTVACCLLAWAFSRGLGVEQAGTARRAAESSALAVKDDHSAERYARMVAKARAYNRRLAATPQVIGELSGEDGAVKGDFGFKSDREYQSLLDFGDGIMATIEIPSIGVDLPVRHGADAYALDNGAGHLHGTSLPVGGKSTHSVITGHTGVADKALFTRLTELRKGDVFYVKVAAQTLAYKVTRIRTVDPDDLRSVRVEPGRRPGHAGHVHADLPEHVPSARHGERASMPGDAPYPEDAPKTSRRDMRPYLVSGVTLLAGLPAAVVASRRKTRPYGRHGRKD